MLVDALHLWVLDHAEVLVLASSVCRRLWLTLCRFPGVDLGILLALNSLPVYYLIVGH